MNDHPAAAARSFDQAPVTRGVATAASGAGASRVAGALALSVITVAFWAELLLEGDRAGFLGSLRRMLLALTEGFPAALQIAVCAGAPFAALGLALLSLRDVRSRKAGYAALAASALLVSLVLAAALGGGSR